MSPIAKRRIEGACLTLARGGACALGIVVLHAGWHVLLPYILFILAVWGVFYSLDALRRRW